MITIFEASTEYTQLHILPDFTPKQLRQIGAFCAYHFKNYWGIQNPNLASNAGYILSKEPGIKALVISYPDEFKYEIFKRISLWILQEEEKKLAKAKPVVASPGPSKVEKKERKRIPINSKPVFSTSKSISPFKD